MAVFEVFVTPEVFKVNLAELLMVPLAAVTFAKNHTSPLASLALPGTVQERFPPVFVGLSPAGPIST